MARVVFATSGTYSWSLVTQIYSITVSQVMVATVTFSKWWLQLYQQDPLVNVFPTEKNESFASYSFSYAPIIEDLLIPNWKSTFENNCITFLQKPLTLGDYHNTHFKRYKLLVHCFLATYCNINSKYSSAFSLCFPLHYIYSLFLLNFFFLLFHYYLFIFIKLACLFHVLLYSYLMGVDAIDQTIWPEVLGMTNCSIAWRQRLFPAPN